MRKFKSFWVLGFCVVLLLVFIVSLNSNVNREPVPPQKTYKLKEKGHGEIPAIIKQRTDSKIQEANDALEGLIDVLKSPFTSDQVKNITPVVEMAFAQTYLRNPKMWNQDGQQIAHGWGQVLEKLWEYRQKHNNPIVFQDVEIELDYLAYELGRPDPENDVDLKIDIRSHLDIGSEVILGGDLEHRRTCDPYP